MKHDISMPIRVSIICVIYTEIFPLLNLLNNDTIIEEVGHTLHREKATVIGEMV